MADEIIGGPERGNVSLWDGKNTRNVRLTDFIDRRQPLTNEQQDIENFLSDSPLRDLFRLVTPKRSRLTIPRIERFSVSTDIDPEDDMTRSVSLDVDRLISTSIGEVYGYGTHVALTEAKPGLHRAVAIDPETLTIDGYTSVRGHGMHKRSVRTEMPHDAAMEAAEGIINKVVAFRATQLAG